MRGLMKPVVLAACGLCSFQASDAQVDARVGIKVTNDNDNDVFVSLYDMNTTPPSKLLSHQRINGFASIPISVTADSGGKGHVYWTALSADPDMRKCGRKDKPGLSTDASVHVYAKSDCPAR